MTPAELITCVLLPKLGSLLGVLLELGLLVLELGLEAGKVSLLGLELGLELSLLSIREGGGGGDVLLEGLDEGLVRVDLGLDVGDLRLVGVLDLQLLVQESLVGLSRLMGSLLLSLLDSLGMEDSLAVGNSVPGHLLVSMKGRDVVLDLHHLALKNLTNSVTTCRFKHQGNQTLREFSSAKICWSS